MAMFGLEPGKVDHDSLEDLSDEQLVELKYEMEGEPPHAYTEADFEYVLEESFHRFAGMVA